MNSRQRRRSKREQARRQAQIDRIIVSLRTKLDELGVKSRPEATLRDMYYPVEKFIRTGATK